jgi:hypothetical protein
LARANRVSIATTRRAGDGQYEQIDRTLQAPEREQLIASPCSIKP